METNEYKEKVQELFLEFFKEFPFGSNVDLANFMFEKGVMQGKAESGVK